MFRVALSLLWAQLRSFRQEDGSVTLEQILVSATLVATAVGAGALIIAKVTDQARAIPSPTP
jgi:hypothetical protein